MASPRRLGSEPDESPRWQTSDQLTTADETRETRTMPGKDPTPKPVRFTATLELAGKTATGMEVPQSVVDQLGGGKRPPVKVTINGYTYRNTIAVMGGRFLLGVSAEHRDGAGVSAGQTLDVTVELDAEPRTVE